MKTLTIDPKSNIVYVDGIGRTVDCSSLPDEVHAVQWDDVQKKGWIEYEQSVEKKPWEGKPHKPITSCDPYMALVAKWSAVMSDSDLMTECDLRCRIETLDIRIQERERDGLPKDQLETERKQLLAEREAVHAKYRKAKVKG